MQYSLALLLLVAVAVRAAHWGGDGCTWATTDVKTAYGSSSNYAHWMLCNGFDVSIRAWLVVGTGPSATHSYASTVRSDRCTCVQVYRSTKITSRDVVWPWFSLPGVANDECPRVSMSDFPSVSLALGPCPSGGMWRADATTANSSFPAWAVALVVIGCVVLVAALLAIVVIVLIKRRARSDPAAYTRPLVDS